jgi:hypothetical protein
MALPIETFTALRPGSLVRPGGNAGGMTLFKALGHPIAARKARALVDRLAGMGPVALVDAHGQAVPFAALNPLDRVALSGLYVQRVEEIGEERLGLKAEAINALSEARPRTVLVASFDAPRLVAAVRALVGAEATILSLDELRLPDEMVSVPANYLDPLNFATNFALFRDREGLHTRVVGANYWSLYGAKAPRLFLALFDEAGQSLAEWFEELPPAGAAFSLDSREIRARFGLGPFAGSLFIHAVGAAGHDVVKYALDLHGEDASALTCTHDANAWPADLYAGLPAPAPGERVTLWIQNSHPVPIPDGAVGLNAMGSQEIAWLSGEVPAFGTRAVDVGAALPGLAWPAQIEVQAGRHFVRPRYEIVDAAGRRHMAHANVERTDLKPDPGLPTLGRLMGKGYIMPLPVLPLAEFATLGLPTPMTTAQAELPLMVALVDGSGETMAERFLGRLARRESMIVDVDAWLADAKAKLPSGHGHLEFRYDFRDGGEGDGWLHAIGRYELRASGHRADTSFGAHIYNTALVYRDEPQSYNGKPPGLTTRLFLRLGRGHETLCHLVYPASLPWHPRSSTRLELKDGRGVKIAEREVAIPCGGSVHLRLRALFGADAMTQAGPDAHVVVDDRTCRLFGFHGLLDPAGAFSLDHMFGF